MNMINESPCIFRLCYCAEQAEKKPKPGKTDTISFPNLK